MGIEDTFAANDGRLVPWERIGQERFDELVEALVPYQHPLGSRVDAVDGRGGDDGVDVAAREPHPETGKVVLYRDEHGRLVVYQLKYFPEGFSGPHGGRRKQIKKSLNQAIRKNPDMTEWVLVAPCRGTPGDLTFLEKLREAHPDLTITFVARADLNGEDWVAGHPDVARALITRDEMLQKMALAGRERDVLAGGLPDLVERQRGLDTVMDDSDPHWSWRVHTMPTGPEIHRLVPKHPQAAAVSPIGFDLEVTESSEGDAFRRALRYGSLEPIVLPGEVITKFELTGPSVVQSANRDDSQIVRLEMHQIRTMSESVPLALQLYDDQQQLMRSHQGRATNFDHGTHGSTFRHEFHGGGFVIEWQLPFSQHQQEEAPASAKITFDLDQNRSCAAVLGVTDLALTLGTSASVRLVTARGDVLAHIGSPSPTYDDEQRQHLTILRETADDLTYLEREFQREFVFPETISALQRIDLRVLRLLLEGHAACGPYAQRLHLDVKPEALQDPSFRSLLEKPHQIVSFTKDGSPVPWSIDAVSDQGDVAVVTLSEAVGVYFPELVAENADEVRTALTDGQSARLNLHSPSQLRPRQYLPDRMRGNAKIELHPWGLTDIDEVPELQTPAAPAADVARGTAP